MGTLGDMKARIADELLRPDLTSRIALAIITAIKHYQRRRFLFNEAMTTFPTVAAQEWYTATDNPAIVSAVQVDRLRILQGTSRLRMEFMDAGEMDALAVSTGTRGLPLQWAYETQQLRLYPNPDAAYTITMYYVSLLAVPASDGASNGWTDDAEIMIRARSKRTILKDVIGIRTREQTEDYQLWGEEEDDAYRDLQGLVSQRRTTGMIRPTAF